MIENSRIFAPQAEVILRKIDSAYGLEPKKPAGAYAPAVKV